MPFFNTSPESKASDVAYLVVATIFQIFISECFIFFFSFQLAFRFQACRGSWERGSVFVLA